MLLLLQERERSKDLVDAQYWESEQDISRKVETVSTFFISEIVAIPDVKRYLKSGEYFTTIREMAVKHRPRGILTEQEEPLPYKSGEIPKTT